MPAIEPQRLSQETDRLLQQLGQPEDFVRAVLERLEFYADRTKRSGLVDEIAGRERSFNIRSPVLRSLRREFTRAAGQRPAEALPAAQHLWDSGWGEARILAAAMLQATVKPAAAAQVERWAETTEDRQVLLELAAAGTAGLRRASPAGFLRAVRGWLKSGRERPRLIALLALRAAVQDQDFLDLPGLFRSLHGAASAVRGESRRALRALIEALAQRSPAEAASFLLQEFNPTWAPLVQQTLPAFPERQRSVLLERLSAYRQTGIMPAS